MEKYIGLINPSKLKLEFLFDLFLVFSPENKSVSQRNWNYIYLRNGHHIEYNGFDKGRKQLIQKEGNIYRECGSFAEVLNITDIQYALIDKVENMLDKGAGLKDVIIMLNSFSRPKGLNGVRGTKRLRTNIRGDEDYHEWTEKDGNEKLSHKGNLPNAHFRWNYGERYTLTDEELNKIQEFINPYLKLLN